MLTCVSFSCWLAISSEESASIASVSTCITNHLSLAWSESLVSIIHLAGYMQNKPTHLCVCLLSIISLQLLYHPIQQTLFGHLL